MLQTDSLIQNTCVLATPHSNKPPMLRIQKFKSFDQVEEAADSIRGTSH